jgi:hypothetical protein
MAEGGRQTIHEYIGTEYSGQWPHMMTCDGRIVKETLSTIYQHSSIEALSPCQLYINPRPKRVKKPNYETFIQ